MHASTPGASAPRSRSRCRRTLAAILLSLLAGSACPGPTAPPPVAFTLWNRSQFELKAVYAHGEPEPVMELDLLAGRALTQEEARTVELQGGPYFTAVRPRVDGASDLAVTTEAPLEVDRDGYTLVIFDFSFRLLSPDSPDNPYAELRPDAGSED